MMMMRIENWQKEVWRGWWSRAETTGTSGAAGDDETMSAVHPHEAIHGGGGVLGAKGDSVEHVDKGVWGLESYGCAGRRYL